MDWLDWVLVVARVVVVFVAVLIAVVLLIWTERKVAADMQTRMGPMRAGPRGVLITLADGLKLFFKEGITPALADRPVYLIAPIVAMIPAFLAFAVIPFGVGVTLFGRQVPFQVADLNVGILWVLAMGSLMVYGIVLAGWSSGSNYPLLGSIRSSAQMISYEVGMGLALVAVIMYSGTLQMSQIVASQAGYFHLWFIPIPRWNVFPMFPAFAIYLVAGLAEINRPPFDLPEAETELVAGYFTEYSGFKFALFYLGEYVNMVVVCAIVVTLFLGGWHGPHPSFLGWLWPLVWFVAKLFVVAYFYMWVRLTLPRVRYDRLMNFGWKILIPVGLLWVLATGAVVVLPDVYGRRAVLIGGLAVFGVVLVVSLLWPLVVPARQTAPELEP